MNDHFRKTYTSVQNETCTIIWTVCANSYRYGIWHVELYRYEAGRDPGESGIGHVFGSDTCKTEKVAALIRLCLIGCGTSTPTRLVNRIVRETETAMFAHEYSGRQNAA